MSTLGDFDASTVIYGKFTTYRPSTGAAYTLGGTPALSVYKDNSTTQSTAGVTLTADFDSVTGLNHFAIDTSADGTFYSAGSFFDIVITTGTVDSVSVVGAVVASFTIRKNSALKPATAGRTVVVDAAGLVDANAVKVGPSGSGTAQTARDLGASVLISSGTGTGQLDVTSGVVKANLAQILGTALTETAGQIAAAFKKFFNIPTPASTMDSLTLVATATSVTNGVTVSTNNDKTGYALTSVYDAAKTASQAGDAMTLTSGERTSVAAAIWNALTSGLTTASSIGKLLVDNINATISSRLASTSYTAPPSAADNAGAVWDEALAGHATAGSAGAALAAAGTAGDPWATPLPGAYGAGTAGNIVGNNLDAAVSTRSTYAGADTSGTTTLLSRLGTPSVDVSADIAAAKAVADAIKAKTDPLTYTKANELDVNIQSVNDVTVNGTGALGDEWGP